MWIKLLKSVPLSSHYLNVNASWSAADFSLLSAVHSGTPVNWADAKRWTSTKPTPFPIRWFLSIKNRNSSNSIVGAIGRDWSKGIISFRFFRLPQASSPTINGWHITSASINSFSSCRLPWWRWVTQIEVSTRTMVVFRQIFFLGWNADYPQFRQVWPVACCFRGQLKLLIQVAPRRFSP